MKLKNICELFEYEYVWGGIIFHYLDVGCVIFWDVYMSAWRLLAHSKVSVKSIIFSLICYDIYVR